MLVTKELFPRVMKFISEPDKHNAIDTETTGLKYWEDTNHWGDPVEIFSIIVARAKDVFYFNFNNYDSYECVKKVEKLKSTETKSGHSSHTTYSQKSIPVDPSKVLPLEFMEEFQKVFDEKSITWFIHNAKFDLAMFRKHHLEIKGIIHDTEAQARVLRSDIFKSNLQVCVERMNKDLGLKDGLEKSDAVVDYMRKNKLIEKVNIPGKKKESEERPYYRVPLHIMQPYGELDVLTGYQLGVHQVKEMEKKNKIFKSPPFTNTMEVERNLSKVCFEMESVGIKIDRKYCESSYNHNRTLEAAANDEIQKHYDCKNGKFDNTATQICSILKSLGIEYQINPWTKKPILDKRFLGSLEHDIGKHIIEWRKASKAANTYFASYLNLAGKDDVIHPNMRQGGTTTGRFSYWDPNLQNVTKQMIDDVDDVEEDGIVRRSFIPREDYVFVMMDYDQMEYRMLVDMAQDMGMVNKIVNEGLDVHEAGAALMGCSRQQAKTINFLLAYGGGIAKLAAALGVSEEEAKNIKREYFNKIPKVKKWFYNTMNSAKRLGYVVNWAGRVCYVNKEYGYRGPNYRIQGGCADVVKRFMINTFSYLAMKKARSRMCIQIHDELLFEFHKDELDLIEPIRQMAELAYPHKHIPLTAGVDHSYISWADKVEGAPK